jgi:apolipoprotein N-acyltransferase
VILRALADGVMLSWGWRRAALALAAGATGALAQAPFGLWPVLIVPFSVAVWLLDGVAGPGWLQRLRQGLLDGWFWGFGYFLAGLWWLGAAFLVEAERFAWAMPLGVLGLPAVLALFPAVGFAVAALIWRPGIGRILVLTGALGASELARGHLFTGFPWNAYGQALAASDWLAQSASMIGLHGLTLVAIALAAAPAVWLTAPRSPARRALLPVAALLLAAMAGFGAWRLPAGAVPEVAGVRLRLMQPNLPQDDKFRPDLGPAILARYLALSDRATSPARQGLADVTHLIWPESAFPFLLAREPRALADIARALPPGVTLVTGAARAGAELPGEGRPPIHNSIHVIDSDGAITASYDKHHLVPFGEYLPEVFRSALDLVGLRPFVAIPGGFTPAAGPVALDVPGLPPVAAAICYEIIFPGAVVPSGAARRPGLILNVTNDAWFGFTPGPYQHLAQARLRAVEEGLPVVRAANNGISAVIDPYGRSIGHLPLGAESVLDTGLPVSLRPTTFALAGNLPATIFVMILLTIGLARARRAPRGGDRS